MNNSTRVIINTGFLYANMLVTLVVQLIAVRLVLKALGQTDYGIYTIIAGIVAMFAFMNVAMSAATQRYLSFTIGIGNCKELSEVFYNSILLHIAIGLFVLLILEAGGNYYVENMLQAPDGRIPSAKILLHCITFSTLVNILAVPYEAALNANEDLGTIAIINILDSLMKLGVAYCIQYTAQDKLIVYGFLTAFCISLTFIIKIIYCKRNYPESRFQFHRIKQWNRIKDISSFAMWNLIGSGCSVARYQGTAIILNSVFGILINTAYGIAQQVNGLLLFFANTIVRAIRPQIIKSEGAGNRERMLQLSYTTCKITSLMIALLVIPLYVEMEFILAIWLHHSIPEECVMFCRAFLVIVFINQLTIGLQVAIESTGKIKVLQSVVGTMHFLSLPVGFIFLKMGYPPHSIMFCIIVEEFIDLLLRTIIAHRQTGLKYNDFLLRNVIPCLCVSSTAWFLSSTLHNVLPSNDWIRCISICTFNTLFISTISYLYILNGIERLTISSFIKSLQQKTRIRP